MAQVIRFPEDKQEPASPFGQLFLGLGLILLIAALAWGGVLEYRLRTWPKVEVTTVKANVIHQSYGGCSGNCTSVTVQYTIDGKQYLRNSCFGDICSPNKRMEEKLYEWWPGTKHTVPYVPGDPTQLKMLAGYNIDYFVGPVTLGSAALTLLVIGSFAYVVTTRSQRRRMVAAMAKRMAENPS